MSPTGDALRVEGVTRRYGDVAANEEVSLRVGWGEVHAVLGENGAGKSTLLSIIYGEVRADAGRLVLGGVEVPLDRHAPDVAIRCGVGLVHQHFMLVPTLTVLENVVLGREPTRGGRLRLGEVRGEVAALAAELGLAVDLDRLVDALSVGEKQRVEILKVLWRGARVLLLDEPTAVLTPGEVKELGAVLRKLAGEGRAVVIVTHKLGEVVDMADAATVLRRGRVVAELAKPLDRAALAAAIVGRSPGAPGSLPDADVWYEPSHPQRRRGNALDPAAPPALQLTGLRVIRPNGTPAVDGIDLSIPPGEILGIAGVEGNGQRELLEAIAGLHLPTAGSIRLAGRDVTAHTPSARFAEGLAHVPEDRRHRGLVAGFDLSETYLLGRQRELSRGGLIDRRRLAEHLATALRDFDVRPPDPRAPVVSLSGGNQQKLLVAREVGRPGLRVLLAAQPTRGVDVGAAALVHAQLRAIRDAGVAVLLVSSDLDELRALSDRIAVLYRGRLAATLGPDASDELLGTAMTGAAA